MFEDKHSLTEHNIKTINTFLYPYATVVGGVCYLWFWNSTFSLNRVWKLQLCLYQAEWLNYGPVVQIQSDADWWFWAFVLNYGVCLLRKCKTIAANRQVRWSCSDDLFSILHIFTLRFPDDTFPLMKINGSLVLRWQTTAVIPLCCLQSSLLHSLVWPFLTPCFCLSQVSLALSLWGTSFAEPSFRTVWKFKCTHEN